jgi:hypothetical protein
MTFTQTCFKPYDKHKYKLFLKNGKVELYEWYDDLLRRWITASQDELGYVEVVDRKKK